jgi:hypothetical protein
MNNLLTSETRGGPASESIVLANERRNFLNRADTMRKILGWLRSEDYPVRELPSHLIPRAAGLRILKHWAIRGLVRKTEGGWMPLPWLFNPPSLMVVTDEM